MREKEGKRRKRRREEEETAAAEEIFFAKTYSVRITSIWTHRNDLRSFLFLLPYTEIVRFFKTKKNAVNCSFFCSDNEYHRSTHTAAKSPSGNTAYFIFWTSFDGIIFCQWVLERGGKNSAKDKAAASDGLTAKLDSTATLAAVQLCTAGHLDRFSSS